MQPIVELYLILVISFHAVDERYHCNKTPTLNIDDWHLVCNWTEDDFEEIITEDGALVRQLKKENSKDNYFKKKVRDRYWIKEEIK